MFQSMFIILFFGVCFGKLENLQFESRRELLQNLSKLYGMHFNVAKTINVCVLKGVNHKNIVDLFTNSLLQGLYFTKTVVLSKNDLISFNPHRGERYSSIIYRDRSQHPIKNEDEILKIQRYSSDPEDIFLLIVWHPEILHLYLDLKAKEILNKARAVYSIFLVFKDENGCNEELEKEILNILLRLWFEFKILNASINAPRSCYHKNIYIYNPFKKISPQNWGVLTIYQVNQLVKYPYLMFNDLTQFHGIPLNISMFPRSPTVLYNVPKNLVRDLVHEKIKNITNYDGLDAAVLASMAMYLNFTINNLYNGDYYGSVFENGTITGSLGHVVDKTIHLSANGWFMKDYNTTEIEFTIPYTNDQICVIVPKSGRIPQWLLVFHCFQWTAWLFLGGIFLICGFIWCLNNINDVARSWLQLFSIFIASPARISASNRLGIFLGSCMIVNIIMGGIFQGSLVRSFSTITYYPDIDTLEDLDKSGLTIYSSIRIFGGKSELMKRLSKKTKRYLRNVVTLDEVAFRREIAGVEREQDAQLFLKSKYLGPTGNPLIHIVKECPVSYFVAYIAPVGSPLVPRINWVLRRFVEGGLIGKWYKDTVDSLILEYQIRIGSKEQIQKAFTVGDLQTAFFLFIGGSVISTMVFVTELLLFGKKDNKKTFVT